ncbi:hypothetical protein J2Z69_002132 [Paenibacillus shirakamiensis]|uniref:Uncharacterized protein n=1 Tax=Paenibacillus shirakamiensis TaxID=1265935 RepID=A0ABS4JKF7_9BACL|nr:endolytic transglycosylase MltG [Paenibacillus shirakamiensis]MBP2001089.1 hypothetical protein [Paenibacillus shirakamiensis]
MKNRLFMLGLGIGLIAGALLLQIMNFGQGSSTGTLATREQIDKAAIVQGLKVYSSEDKVYTEKEWQEKQAKEKASKEKPVTPTKEPVVPKAVVAPTTPEQPANKDDNPSVKAPANSTTSSPKEPSVTTFTIVSGDTLNDVAAGLKKAGIINDASGFVQVADGLKANYRLQMGDFQFKKGENVESIITKITKPATSK